MSSYYNDGVNSYTYEQTQSQSPPLIPDIYDSASGTNALTNPASPFMNTTALNQSNVLSNFGVGIYYAFRNGAPSDYQTFRNSLQYLNDNSPLTLITTQVLTIVGQPLDLNDLTQGFFNHYMAAMGSSATLDLDSQGNILGISNIQGDLGIFANNTDFPTILGNSFKSTLDGFIASTASNLAYYANSSTLSEDAANTFINAYQTYIGKTFFSLQSLEISTNDPNPVYLASYEQIYNGFASNPTQTGFLTDLQAFVDSQVASNGAFNPTKDFPNWVASYLPDPIAGYTKLLASNNYAITGSTLDGNNSDSVLIINRILALLIKMIGVLQDVGISQAKHLNFTTSFQKAYTGLQSQIPTFTLNQKGGPGGSVNGTTLVISGKDQSTNRQEINATINGGLADNLRALNSLQQDSAKQQQSNINQTNDAVNSQTDMATTFLQQLNTLLSAILR